jgi:thiamine transport system ATP-binding protein
MDFLRWEKVTKDFGRARALDGISLSVGRGEILGVLGPSGSGKSTLLRVTAGLESATSGRVLAEGEDLAGTPPHRRGLGLMFQDYCLFPHLDVNRNIEFGLRMARWSREGRKARVEEMLHLVHMQGYGRRDVLSLSGGEQQRVALARSLAPGPRALMLDEPLGALDSTLKTRLLSDLSQILREVGVTVLYVTHDHEEAMTISARVAVLRAGVLQQVATPAQLVACPTSAFVAEFLGLGAVVPCRLHRLEGAWYAATPFGDIRCSVTRAPAAATGAGVTRLLVRPQALRAPAGAGRARARAKVLARLVKGGTPFVRIAINGENGSAYELECLAGAGADNGLDRAAEGEIVDIDIDPALCLALPGT